MISLAIYNFKEPKLKRWDKEGNQEEKKGEIQGYLFIHPIEQSINHLINYSIILKLEIYILSINIILSKRVKLIKHISIYGIIVYLYYLASLPFICYS